VVANSETNSENPAKFRIAGNTSIFVNLCGLDHHPEENELAFCALGRGIDQAAEQYYRPACKGPSPDFWRW
jgi:hypothetical protein